MVAGDSDISKILTDALIKREVDLAKLAAERDAEPFSAPPFHEWSKGVYAPCISPSDALSAYRLSSKDLAVTQLVRELKSDRVKAICDEAIWFLNGKKARQKFAAIECWLWLVSAPDAKSDFWETGYFRTLIPANKGQTNFQGDVELFGVRISTVNLPGFEEPASEVPSSVQREATGPLPEAEARRISRIVIDAYGPSVTEKRAVELARGLCPDHKVARDPFLDIFREIRGPKNPGKPKSDG